MLLGVTVDRRVSLSTEPRFAEKRHKCFSDSANRNDLSLKEQNYGLYSLDLLFPSANRQSYRKKLGPLVSSRVRPPKFDPGAFVRIEISAMSEMVAHQSRLKRTPFACHRYLFCPPKSSTKVILRSRSK